MKPIQGQLGGVMNQLAAGLAKILKPYGFCLFVFPMETPGGRFNYISNAKREDILVLLKEFIAECEGRRETTETMQ